MTAASDCAPDPSHDTADQQSASADPAGNSSTMPLDAARAATLLENLSSVRTRISHIARPNTQPSSAVRLIAVSKLKPASDILALHQPSSTKSSAAPQLDFGENYAQELSEKAALLPRSIRWHMIGALQTNKCRPLAENVPNLFSVSSVDSAKKADGLEKGRAACKAAADAEKLRVLIQVNTSGEANKSGVEPSDALALAQHVREHCPHLVLGGFMTIGAIARSQASADENEDFTRLREARDRVAEGLGIDPSELQLSMGMSADFETAIGQGSDEVRVGTTIFGTRPPKNEAVI